MKENSECLYKPFIQDVFSSFTSGNISYVVLRNYADLPIDPGHDIDLLVESGTLSFTGKFLKEAAEKNNWQLVHHVKRYGFQTFVFISKYHDNLNKSLKWDIWDPISWKGITWIDTNEVMKYRNCHPNGFYIPSPGHEAAILLLKEVLQAGFIREKYLSRINTLVQDDQDIFNNLLKFSFGEKMAESLTILVKKQEWKSIERDTQKIRRSLLIHSFLKKPVTEFINIFQFIQGHLIDFIRGRNSLMICLIGPDGSGKSTVSSHLIENMEDLFEDIRYYHGHYQILPELSRFLRIKQTNFEIQSNSCENKKEKQTPRLIKRLRKMIIISYYSVDYIIGRLINIINRNKSQLIVFDRYFYDYVLQPSFFTINSLTYRLLSFFVPKPDLLFYLEAPAEVIHTRKQELTLYEITRQARICKQLTNILHNGYCIDNTQSLEIVLYQLRCIIVETLEKRYGGNNG